LFVCVVLVWDGLLAELSGLLAVEVRLLAELDGIPTLHYGIPAEGGWLPVERDLLEFNAVGFSFGRKASLLKFTRGGIGFTCGRGALTRGTGWNTHSLLWNTGGRRVVTGGTGFIGI